MESNRMNSSNATSKVLPKNAMLLEVMNPTDCHRFDSCSAPICPLLGCSGIWYPDEEICQAREYNHEPWIRNQKKIARKVRNKDFYFTKEMLERNCIITTATEGLDPDKSDLDDERALTDWLRKHPEKRKLSDAERAEIGLRLKRGLDLIENEANYRQNSSSSGQSAKEFMT